MGITYGDHLIDIGHGQECPACSGSGRYWNGLLNEDRPCVDCDQATQSMRVESIPDEKLIERAVRNARTSRKGEPKWCAVSKAFGLGSTYSAQLCRRFGIDPYQVR